MTDHLTSHNPYRYPAFDPNNPNAFERSLPATDANIKKCQTEWEDLLSIEAIQKEKERTSNLSFKENAIEGQKRLGLAPSSIAITLTFYYRTPGLYQSLLNLPSIQQKLSQQEKLTLACFGAGYLDLHSSDSYLDLEAYRYFVKQYKLPLKGLIIEPFDILVMLASPFTNSHLDVFDFDKRVIDQLNSPDTPYLLPLFDHQGQPFPESLHRDFINEFIRITQTNHKTVLNGRNENEKAYAIKLNKNLTQKMNPQLFNLATQNFSPDYHYDIGFCLQTFYFIHPLLQRTLFIKLIHHLNLGGYLVSDYLLTEAETKLFGLNIKAIGDTLLASDNKGRDQFIYVYEKLKEADVVKELAKRG